MGYGSWSGDAYDHISAPRKGMDYGTARSTVFSGKLKESLDPKGVKMRESRDSDAHPESNAIGVLFDVTGSMGDIPVEFAQHKLGGLMKMLVDKSVIPHPQVLFGAIGDAYVDRAPFQVGQFESGIEMDQCLTDIYIESGGGGQIKESYGLGHYFFARHTAIDCWEKRGKKGYLFTLGDEQTWPEITPDEALRIFGDTIQGNEKVVDLIRECERRYEVFHIVVATGTSQSHPEVLGDWRKLLGERALQLDDPNNVCELIAATIGLCEGQTIDAMNEVLRAAGASAKTVKSVGAAIVPLRDSLARSGGSVEGKLAKSGKKSGAARI
jgi:hypothetical protein